MDKKKKKKVSSCQAVLNLESYTLGDQIYSNKRRKKIIASGTDNDLNRSIV